jgi:predicted extracellular nuclease
MVAKSHSETPLIAAFFVCVITLTSCKQAVQVPELAENICESSHIPISSIQGSGETSPMLSQEVVIRGIATYVLPSKGLFIEDSNPDDSGETSNGLFIDSPELSEVIKAGDKLFMSGTVMELGDSSNTITALTGISGFKTCASYQSLPDTPVKLPLSTDEREALEGMLISIGQEVVITDVYYAASGLLAVNLGGVMPAPTEIARPGPDARAQAAKNRKSSLNIELLGKDQELFPAGTRLMGLKGVLGHDGRGLRLSLFEPLRIIPSNPTPLGNPGENELRVVGINLLNYFNGDGQSGEFPTPRGAKTVEGFSDQRARLSATISLLKPHLVAVMELENDGFEANSAARDFISDLESATGETWLVIPHDAMVGEDVISVGLFYREDKLEPIGKAGVLTSPEFQGLSRAPMAQNFQDKASGESFLVVVNHLKSKGSCPPDGRNSDLNDGQGCWNLARTQAAQAMTRWTNTLANKNTGGKALILGDMNAYRMENPITAIIDAGFSDLKAASAFGSEFSYIRFGAAGTLDYAFASPKLRPHVQSTRIMHINSNYPPGVDLPRPWLRSSDHDPVVVDLRFRQSATLD